jgi:hypothetical protein
MRRLDEFIADLASPTAVATATIPCVAVNRGVYFYHQCVSSRCPARLNNSNRLQFLVKSLRYR